MKLIITIDVEEDNWGGYDSGTFSVENVSRLPMLQEMFARNGVKPTYLVTYPVVNTESSMRILHEVSADGGCEIGAHLHAWNTPPLAERSSSRDSMACNLSSSVQFSKLCTLTNAIHNNFGKAPISFRTGRWGINADLTHNLKALGYKVDSSVTPYVDWSHKGGLDFSDIPLRPYWISTAEVMKDASPDIIEIPPSIGFLQENFANSSRLYKIVRNDFWRKLHLYGLMYRLRLLNLVWLSPELHTSSELLGLAANLVKQNVRFLNLTFHSPSLVAGMAPFVKNLSEEKEMIKKLSDVIAFCKDHGVGSATLAEAASEIADTDHEPEKLAVKV